MKIKPVFWTGLGMLFVMLYAFGVLDQLINYEPGQEREILTADGFFVFVAMFFLAALLVLALLIPILSVIGRRAKRDAALAYGIPESETEKDESAMEMLERNGKI